MLNQIAQYSKDSYNELVHKTTWPSVKQLTSQALLVLNASILIALVVFGIDMVFEFCMKLIYGFIQ